MIKIESVSIINFKEFQNKKYQNNKIISLDTEKLTYYILKVKNPTVLNRIIYINS